MTTDKLTNVLLAAIAIALLMIALNPWLRPVPIAAQAQISFDCTGELKANAWGGIEPTIGGYEVELSCD